MTALRSAEELFRELGGAPLRFDTYTDGDLREAIRPAQDGEAEAHVATLCEDGNVVWYTEWCSLPELRAVTEEFERVWKERGG